MKRPVVDNNKCVQCGMCENICPDVFELNTDDLKIDVKDTVYSQYADEIAEAAKSCPVQAIGH